MKNTVLIFAILVLFVACGDDNGTKVSEPADDSASLSVVSSSSKTVKSSSSKTVIQSGDSHGKSSSSSSKHVIQSGDSHEESSSSSSKIASQDCVQRAL